MELFIIQCTTCRARLKVNDESVIGDILACPKCGSMVQVVPPVDWKQTGEAAPSVQPETALSRPTEAPPAPKAAAVLPPLLPQRSSSQLRATSAPATESASAPSARAAAPSLYSRMISRLKQDWIIVSCGLAAGIVLGTSAWLLLSGGAVAPQLTAAARQDGENAAQQPVEPRQVVERPVAKDQSAPPVAAAGAGVPSTRINNDSAGEALGDPRSAAADQTAELPRPEAVQPADAVEAPQAPRMKLDPVEKPSSPQQPQRDIAASTDDAGGATEQSELPGAANKRSAESDSSTSGAGAPKLTSDEIEERLGVPLPAIKFVDVPLAQFVEFVSNFAGLPITIDDAALTKIGKKRQSPVTVRLKDTTAQEALASGVKSLGLTCLVRDGQLVVTAGSK